MLHIVGSEIKTPDMHRRLKKGIKYMKMLSFPHWQFTSLTYEAILFFFKNKFNVMIISISRTDYLIGNKQTGLILKQLQEVIDHIWANSNGHQGRSKVI